MPFKTIGVKVEGSLTDIILSSYENKLLIVVTQTQKFGSVLRVEKEIFQALDAQENVFSIQTVFGKEDDQNSLFARILCEKVQTTKSIILIVNLKVSSPLIMKGLVQKNTALELLIASRIWRFTHLFVSECYCAAMTIFGQLVIGPPGSGKSTYCCEMQKYLMDRGRKVAIVNFDPANDSPPYAADIDISEYTTTEDVMNFLHVGPNCAVLYCMEFLERCAQKIIVEIVKKKECYFLIDCPGQVELYTHHQSLKNILAFFESVDLRLCCVHLVDSHYCSDAGKFISTLLLSLSAMLHIGLPHLNVLSKMDLLCKFENKLLFTLDYYTDVLDLSYLIECLDQDAITSKHKKLNQALASFIEAYGLVRFIPLNVRDVNTLSNVRDLADKANGYVFKSSEERNIFKLLSTAMSSANAAHALHSHTEPQSEAERDQQSVADKPESTLFNYTLDDGDQTIS